MTSFVSQGSRTFRDVFTLPSKKKVQWYPGHMQKGWSQIATVLREMDCVVEVHDARIPFSGRNPKFREIHEVKPHILLLNKSDLTDMSKMRFIEKRLKREGVDRVLYSNCLKSNSKFVTKEIIPAIVEAIYSRPRYSRRDVTEYEIMIIGVPNVGKSTLINLMRQTHTELKKKSMSVGAVAGITRGISGRVRVSHDPEMFLRDTPGILLPNVGNVETGMKLALCGCLPDHLVGEEFIVDYMLYWMNKHQHFEYVKYFDLKEPTEKTLAFLSLIAKRENLVQKLKSAGQSELILKPNFNQAAMKVIQAFRTGKLGKYMLDM